MRGANLLDSLLAGDLGELPGAGATALPLPPMLPLPAAAAPHPAAAPTELVCPPAPRRHRAALPPPPEMPAEVLAVLHPNRNVLGCASASASSPDDTACSRQGSGADAILARAHMLLGGSMAL